MTKGQRSNRRTILFPLIALFGLSIASADPPEQDDAGPKASTNVTDRAECETQLLRIHAALQQYVASHNKLPDWLSDLSREQLIPEHILICPYVQKTRTLVKWRQHLRGDCFLDEKSSYSYEFNATELPLFGGEKITWREYKQKSIKVMGTELVPIVRCFAHRPVLNLAYDGSIYESGTYWEDKFTNRFSHADLTPDALFAQRLHLPRLQGDDFPPRPPELGSRQLDLTRFYNARLTDTWLHAPSFADDLAEFPAGVFEVSGVKFDARGIVQLKGNTLAPPYPMHLEDIPIGQRCVALHFLHATAAQAQPQTQVGRYLLHFTDGSVEEYPLIYGRDISQWWGDPKEVANSGLLVAWQSKNFDSVRGGRKIHLYHSRFENPKPNVPVQSLDLISANSSAAPFLIAVTLE